jgi:hypothetical protein
VFHVELRRFPHVGRAFNLTEDELRAQIVLPWVRGAPVEVQEQRFTPERARLMIYEGPPVAAEERGLGRGWSNVTRDGENVTARVLDAAKELVPRASAAKEALIRSVPLPLDQAVSLVGEGHSAWRSSELLAVVEEAIWELLHEGRVMLVRVGSDAPVAAADWHSLLLAWTTWTGPSAPVMALRPDAPK